MQISGTEAIITQLQPSKPKREITIITHTEKCFFSYLPVLHFIAGKNVHNGMGH